MMRQLLKRKSKVNLLHIPGCVEAVKPFENSLMLLSIEHLFNVLQSTFTHYNTFPNRTGKFALNSHSHDSNHVPDTDLGAGPLSTEEDARGDEGRRAVGVKTGQERTQQTSTARTHVEFLLHVGEEVG